LPFASVPKFLVDAEYLRIVFGKCLDDLHRRETSVAQKFHLTVLEPPLQEEAVRLATRIRAKTKADVRVEQLLDGSLVGFEHPPMSGSHWIGGLFGVLRGPEHREPFGRQRAPEQWIVDERGASVPSPKANMASSRASVEITATFLSFSGARCGPGYRRHDLRYDERPPVRRYGPS
jgi:hypothetical protein